jgi:hypothetical protein
MTFGVMQVGRLALREDSAADLSNGDFGPRLSLAGQESMPRVSLLQLKQRVEDFLALQGSMQPIVFTDKPELNGFYWVESVSATYDKWMPDNVGVLPWSMTVSQAGHASNTDLESRLSGPVTRTNDHAAVGERWHAPPIGHNAWSAGSTIPTVVTRTGSDGAMTVYRGVAVDENPRWGASPTAYLAGRCRLIDQNALERVATQFDLAATGWEIHNGLVKVSVNAGTGLFNISAYTGGAWQSKLWELFHSTGPAVTLGVPDYATVLRNDYECVSVRITKSLAPGRVMVDFTLRRGSRFVEVYVQHQFGTTLKIVRNTTEASTASTGYIVATAADGASNKFILGSAKSFTVDNVNGGISKAATPTLDAFIGVVVNGAGAGDIAADLFKQYLGVPSEFVQGVRR